MGVRSTAVKRIWHYTILHIGGGETKVREVIFVDPSDPETAHIFREVRPPLPVEFIKLSLHVKV